MTDDSSTDDLFKIQDSEHPEGMLEGQIVLTEVCDTHNIDYEIRTDDFDDKYILIKIKNGRDNREVAVYDHDHISELIKTSFYKYIFIGDYRAIACLKENYIEAAIRPSSFNLYSDFYSAIFPRMGKESKRKITISESIENTTVVIELGEASLAASALFPSRPGRTPTSTIKITGLRFDRHDKALSYLQKISNSLFFQIDLKENFSISLIKDRKNKRSFKPKRSSSKDNEIKFPKIELDEAPISLYWYARSAVGMPLLQFLAFYQVIEYYYPSYSSERTKQSIRNIIKDPTFRIERDADIGRILTAMSDNKGTGSELSQLKSTFEACLGNPPIFSGVQK